MTLPADLLERLKSEHRHVYTFDYVDADGATQTLAFRRLKKAEYAEYLATIAEDKAQLARAQERLFRDCVVHPPQAEHHALLDDYPAICIPVAAALIKLAAGDVATSAKKV